MNQENPAASEVWPEDKADWPHAVGVVQGGVSPVASFVVNDRESADLASAVQNVINKAEQKTGFRPDVVVTKHRHAAAPNASRVANQEQIPVSIALDQRPKGIFCVCSTDGKSAYLDVVNGKLVLGGDLPTDEAAEIFMTEMAKSIQNLQGLADGLHALQKHCDGFAEQAAFQRDARLGALKELAKVEGQRDMLLDVLRKAADDLAYVAYNIDGSKLDDLAAGLSESTCPSDTALIAERNCREAISRVEDGAA